MSDSKKIYENNYDGENFNKIIEIIKNTKYACSNEKKYENLEKLFNEVLDKFFPENFLPINVIVDLLILISDDGKDDEWNNLKNVRKRIKNVKNFNFLFWKEDVIESINNIKIEHDLENIDTSKVVIERFCNVCKKNTEQVLKFMQTRSGDESQSVFLNCQVCNTTTKKA